MKGRQFLWGSLLLCGLMTTVTRAQVMQLGKLPTYGHVNQATCDCGGLWHDYGCGAADGCTGKDLTGLQSRTSGHRDITSNTSYSRNCR